MRRRLGNNQPSLSRKENRTPPMRERDREIKRRRQRYQKRKKLRQKLAAAAEGEQQKIEAKIRKTYPTYTPES